MDTNSKSLPSLTNLPFIFDAGKRGLLLKIGLGKFSQVAGLTACPLSTKQTTIRIICSLLDMIKQQKQYFLIASVSMIESDYLMPEQERAKQNPICGFPDCIGLSIVPNLLLCSQDLDYRAMLVANKIL